MKDFNNLGTWLQKKLDDRRMSVEELAVASKVSRRIIYMWMDDSARPTTKTMPKVVRALTEAPVFDNEGNPSQEEVKLEEAYAQYVERKVGRPAGGGGTTKAVTTRSRG